MTVDLKPSWYVYGTDGSIWKPTKPYNDPAELKFPGDYEKAGTVPVSKSNITWPKK